MAKDLEVALKDCQAEVYQLKQTCIQKDLALQELQQELFRAKTDINNLKNHTAESDSLLRSK